MRTWKRRSKKGRCTGWQEAFERSGALGGRRRLRGVVHRAVLVEVELQSKFICRSEFSRRKSCRWLPSFTTNVHHMIDSSCSLQSGRRLSALIVAMLRVAAARLLSAIASRGCLPRWGASKTWNRSNAPPRMMQRDRCDGDAAATRGNLQ
jgi:hypothetical protein